MKIIDSHVHLNLQQFDNDREEVFKRIEEKLDFVVNIGFDLESSEKSVEYANKYPFIYAVIGFHPDEIEGYSDEAEKKLEELAKNPKVLAIGEIGLDYHWMTRPKEEQWDIFRKQLELARRVNKPVVIHTREAMEDTVNILNEFPDITGILHCYPGSVETARRMIDRFYLGIGGVLTFKNARKICGDKPLACNILHAINDYERVVTDALEAGANIIVTGAGLPLELPRLTENYPDVEIVPIVSSARALKIICKKWKAAGRTPGAVIVEGPKSGGHQGAKYDELFAPEHQLEAILPPIKEERDKWGDFPIIAAGGIWDRNDIEKIMDLGADAVQMGTRFIGTHECDASPVLKQVLINAKEEDILGTWLIKESTSTNARFNLIKG